MTFFIFLGLWIRMIGKVPGGNLRRAIYSCQLKLQENFKLLNAVYSKNIKAKSSTNNQVGVGNFFSFQDFCQLDNRNDREKLKPVEGKSLFS